MEHIRKTNEVEMSEKMMKRVEDIDNLTYTYLKALQEENGYWQEVMNL